MKLARTGSHVLLWRAAQKAAGVLAMLAIAHGLGPAGNGRFSLSLLLVTVAAAVLSGGVGLAAVPLLRQRRVAPLRLFAAQGAWLVLVAAGLAVLAAILWRGGVGDWLRDSLGWNAGLLVAMLAAVVALLVFETANYDLLARGEVVAGTRTAAWRAGAHLAVVLALLAAARLDLGGALWTLAAVYLAAAGWLAARALRSWRRCPPAAASGGAAPPPTALGAAPSLPRLAGRLVRGGWLGQLSAISYLLMLRLDQMLLESYLDVAAVGIYAMAAWGAELLWLLPEALNPLLVHSSADDSDPQRDRTAARAVRLGLGVTAVAAVPLALLAPQLFGLLRDGAYAGAVPALWVLLPGVVAFAPGAILAGDFIGRGRSRWNTEASGITVAINVLLCLWWIPRLGILGAAWASTVAYTLGSSLMLLRFRRLTGLPWRDLLLPRPADLRR